MDTNLFQNFIEINLIYKFIEKGGCEMNMDELLMEEICLEEVEVLEEALTPDWGIWCTGSGCWGIICTP